MWMRGAMPSRYHRSSRRATSAGDAFVSYAQGGEYQRDQRRLQVDDERVTPEATAGEGVCVECGGLIPRERMATLADVFRCSDCARGYDASGPAAEEGFRKTA
jgi:RNA polymerase-binding transcription factor DksA